MGTLGVSYKSINEFEIHSSKYQIFSNIIQRMMVYEIKGILTNYILSYLTIFIILNHFENEIVESFFDDYSKCIY